MKLTTYCLIIIAISFCLGGCSHAQTSKTKSEETIQNKKILIVYLSRTKNTKALAEIIHKHIGGDLVEIEVQNPYPENYTAIVEQVRIENETGFLPPIKTKIDSIIKYEFIFVGFPTWGMQLPPPVKSFLKQYDLSGKTIIPFNTNAGYGTGSSFDDVKRLCPDSKFLEGFAIKGGVERDGILFVMEGETKTEVEKEVLIWLKEIGMKK